ncbi:MAG: hypothetical protein EOP87_13725 [Verrucomicrobiaceae bacterium]|nr:MAG: hypothetical protein EOP87_13725 [Verrucomicrobiaceae bacterium]
MKTTRIIPLLLACVCLSCTTGKNPADRMTPELRREKLLQGAASLEAGRDAWLDRQPRKFTTLSVPEEHLPTVLQELGYTDATVTEHHVILLRGKTLSEGTLVFTGPPRRVSELEYPGVTVRATAWPEIKDLFFDAAVIERNATRHGSPARQ